MHSLRSIKHWHTYRSCITPFTDGTQIGRGVDQRTGLLAFLFGSTCVHRASIIVPARPSRVAQVSRAHRRKVPEYARIAPPSPDRL